MAAATATKEATLQDFYIENYKTSLKGYDEDLVRDI